MTCGNHVGYGKDGDPNKWGANICGADNTVKCRQCQTPACVRHRDASKDKPVCMDCYQTMNRIAA